MSRRLKVVCMAVIVAFAGLGLAHAQCSWVTPQAPNTTGNVTEICGNVGIGTASPGAKLDVDAGTAASNEVRLGTGASGPGSENKISFALGSGNARLAQISGLKNNGNDLVSLHFRTIDGQYNLQDRLTIADSGNVGIGNSTPASTLDVAGTIHSTGIISSGSAIYANYQDVAEWVPTAAKLEAGTVVVLDPGQSNAVMASVASYDTTVAGVVSTNPGVLLGKSGADKAMIATTGRVQVKVDATTHAVAIGDILVTSDKPGFAMRSEPLDLGGRKIHQPGTIIGKALEPLPAGQGEILVLLSLQ